MLDGFELLIALAMTLGALGGLIKVLAIGDTFEKLLSKPTEEFLRKTRNSVIKAMVLGAMVCGILTVIDPITPVNATLSAFVMYYTGIGVTATAWLPIIASWAKDKPVIKLIVDRFMPESDEPKALTPKEKNGSGK